MILPNNGKVVIFDDKREDIENLLTALSKEAIPFLYYQDENGNDLPDLPIENIRLVFLDLELVTDNPSESNIIAAIAARLKKVLTINNTYILIYWSTKEEKFRETLEEAFKNGLSQYVPSLVISLNKVEAISNDNPVEYIIDALRKAMAELNSLNAFMLWESSVNDASGRITNEMTSFINKNHKDKGMYGLLYKLSKDQAGKDVIDDYDNNCKLQFAFEVINNSLIEKTETIFNERLHSVNIGDVKVGGRELQPAERIKLNTAIHIIFSEKLQHCYSGNLYLRDINPLCKEIILRNFPADIYESMDINSTKLVCLDITPSCDYAQKKYYTRILFGVKVESKFSKKVIHNDSKYTDLPIVDIFGEGFIIFDYRTLRSFSKEEFLFAFKEKPKFRLRNNLLLDIQAQLSNNINRPGIVNIS